MSKSKMSDIDKFKRVCRKAENITLENFEGLKKIRSKKLRQLLILYVAEWDFSKNPKENIEAGINKLDSLGWIINILKCSKRDAYDFWNAMVIIDKISEKKESDLISSFIAASGAKK